MRILLAGLLFVTRFLVSSAQEITSLILIDSGTNEPVVTLTDGAVIDIRALGFEEPSFNIEALTSPDSVGSVRFDYDGIFDYRTENKEPYALCGDKVRAERFWNSGKTSYGCHSFLFCVC